MTYTLIGTGNMATFFAARMSAAGHSCVGVWGRNRNAAAALCEANGLPQLYSAAEVHDGCDACILAIADAAIAEVAGSLRFRQTTLVHTAGSIAIDALLASAVNAAVVWPVYSIRNADLPQHRSFPALIESTTPAAAGIARNIGAACCDTIVEASGPQRSALHLAAVFGNNFVNHLLGISAEICAAQGLQPMLLQPLIEQTLQGTSGGRAALLQTGPAKRHDHATMQAHLNSLATHPELKHIYAVLSEAIMKRHPLPAGH